jgi:hypothetical protein
MSDISGATGSPPLMTILPARIGPILNWRCPKCLYIHRAPAPEGTQKVICSCIGTTQKRTTNEVATIWVFDPMDPQMAGHVSVNSCTIMERVT